MSLSELPRKHVVPGKKFRIQTPWEAGPRPTPRPTSCPWAGSLTPSAPEAHGFGMNSLKKWDLLSWGLEFWWLDSEEPTRPHPVTQANVAWGQLVTK